MLSAQRISVVAFLFLSTSAVFPGERSQKKPLNLFDGSRKTIVVNGYSTSFHWPAVLQRKLDKYFEGKRVLEVKSATQGGTPIAKWMDLQSGEPREPWNTKLTPLLQDKRQPTIVLAQQSLQWVFGDRHAGIRSKKDTVHIEQGVDALRKYTELLLSEGADHVIIATHIYKKGMEPQIGNERFALAKFMKTSPEKVSAGPDLWEPTKKLWPDAFREDQVHPNPTGAEVMAHYWFISLLKTDGRKVPQWSEEEMRHAIANPPSENKDGIPGRTRPGSIPPFLLKRFDQDGDGKLSPSEKKVLLQERARRRANQN